MQRAARDGAVCGRGTSVAVKVALLSPYRSLHRRALSLIRPARPLDAECCDLLLERVVVDDLADAGVLPTVAAHVSAQPPSPVTHFTSTLPFLVCALCARRLHGLAADAVSAHLRVPADLYEFPAGLFLLRRYLAACLEGGAADSRFDLAKHALQTLEMDCLVVPPVDLTSVWE